MPRVTAVYSWDDDAEGHCKVNADAALSPRGFQCLRSGIINVTIEPPTRLSRLHVAGAVVSVTFKASDKMVYDNLKVCYGPKGTAGMWITCPKYECERLLLEINHGAGSPIDRRRVCITPHFPEDERETPPLVVYLSSVKPLGSMLRCDDETKDFRITTTDGAELHTHLAVLAVHSECFKAMLRFKEGRTSTLCVEESAEAWESIMHFAYERKLKIERATMLDVVEIAVKYQFEDLLPLAWGFVLSNVDARRAPETFLFACRHEHVSLQRRCANLVRSQAEDLIHDLEWIDKHRAVLADEDFGLQWGEAIKSKVFFA